MSKVNKPYVPSNKNKVETPKTVYNRKHQPPVDDIFWCEDCSDELAPEEVEEGLCEVCSWTLDQEED